MNTQSIDLSTISGISYTIYKGQNGRWKGVVWPTDDKYTHRDFLLDTIKKEGRSYADFSSCGILLYDAGIKKWFPIFETSYQETRTKKEKKRDLLLAIRAAHQQYHTDDALMGHLSQLADKKIKEQRSALEKIGLEPAQIEHIILRTRAAREG